MELIKNTIRVGNSAGVLLPKEWLNSRVKVVLQPLNVEQKILDILLENDLLKHVKGIYLSGSYARKEQSIESDVDVLVVTDNINKKIKKEKFEILLISEDELKKSLEKNALPILAMLREAKVILNNRLIEEYVKTPLTYKNIKWHIETTKSALEVVKKDLEISKENNEKVSEGSVYSLVLRLRTLYIIDCIKKNKSYNNKGLLDLIKKITGSLNAYEIYISVKNRTKVRIEISVEETEKLIDYLDKKLREIEKWARGKKD